MPDDKNVATILAICDLITSKQIAIHNANVRRSLSKKGYRSKETARRGEKSIPWTTGRLFPVH